MTTQIVYIGSDAAYVPALDKVVLRNETVAVDTEVAPSFLAQADNWVRPAKVAAADRAKAKDAAAAYASEPIDHQPTAAEDQT
jgi:hypothetical protein